LARLYAHLVGRAQLITHWSFLNGRRQSPSLPQSSVDATRGLTFPHPQFSVRLMDYQKYITIEPGKRGGKPCIRGMRITVYEVLDYLASGMTEAEILADFPDLTGEDLKACLAFAADRERKLVTIP